MLNDKRIVCMTPAGRRRYMRLLVPMVLSNTLIDEYQIWINTTDAGDLAFLRGLKDIPRVKVIEQPKGVVNGNASISDFFVHAADPDTIYIRFDDDIVWMEADTIEKIVDARVADTQSFLVAPVVVNNAVCTNILQNRGIFDTAPYVSSYVMDHVGWGDANFAERLHRHFISSFIDTKQTDRLDIGRQVIGCTRFSINCISWFGEALSSVSDQIGMDDEEFLSCIHPARNGLYNTIVGDTRVAHFAFCTQRDGLDTSDVLARYAIIFNEMDWVDREVAAMVDAACKVGDEIAQHQTYSRKGGSEYASPGLNASTDAEMPTPNLSLPLIVAEQAMKHMTHNESLARLDSIVQLSVLSRTRGDVPESPTQGDRYIVPEGASGDWTGKEDSIAVFENDVWSFLSPKAGWLSWISEEQALAVFSDDAWTIYESPLLNGIDNLPFIGVNASANASDRLSVSASASLLSHEGGDHRLKINKASATHTASTIYQTDFLGGAETGLIGSNDFEVKVSPDGMNWVQAMTVNRTNGHTTFPAGLSSGAWVFAPKVGVNAASGTFRGYSVQSNGLFRFDFGADNTPETGANTGSNFYINRFADDGGYLGTPLSIDRASGQVQLNGGVAQSSANLAAASFVVAELPDAAARGAGAMIYVSDAAGGAILAFSDGTDWRRSDTRDIVS